VRVLDRDLLLVPRALVPAVQALVRQHLNPTSAHETPEGEQPLYAITGGEQAEPDET
jgi:hypothetical protein